jgi:catechol 2,3-dioxygenase-like lactoylglutathione lyase family enzyme
MADALPPGFVNHLRLSVRDIDASGRFYDPLMRCLGFASEPRDDGGRAWGTADATGRMQWLILTPAAPEHAGARHSDLAPGLHHDEPDCYAVFFRDPDGFKLEVLHMRR